jgi:hypothetical protein
MIRSREIWHRIQNFPNYEVNSRGHVRRVGSTQKLIPESGLIGNVVKLWNKGDAKKVKTSDLVKQYFPELEEGGSPIEWRTLKDFPDYEVTPFGGIRNRSTKYDLPVLAMDGFEAKVALWKDGVRGTYGIAKLIEETFSKSTNSVA